MNNVGGMSIQVEVLYVQTSNARPAWRDTNPQAATHPALRKSQTGYCREKLAREQLDAAFKVKGKLTVGEEDDAVVNATQANIDQGQVDPKAAFPPPWNVWDTLTLSWLHPLLKFGFKTPLQPQNAPLLPCAYTSAEVYPTFVFLHAVKFERWQRSSSVGGGGVGGKGGGQSRARGAPPRGDLVAGVLMQLHWPRLALAGTLHLAYAASLLAGPILLQMLTEVLLREAVAASTQQEQPEQQAYLGLDVPRAYTLAALLFALPALGVLARARAVSLFLGARVQIRAELLAAVYRKALYLRGQPRAQALGPDKIGRIAGKECNNVCSLAYPYGGSLVVTPVLLVAAFVLLYLQLEWCAFVGLGVFAMCLPLGAWWIQLQRGRQRRKRYAAGQRQRLAKQLLASIRTLKMYTWEHVQEAGITVARDLELEHLRALSRWRSTLHVLELVVPLVAAAASLSTYAAVQGDRFSADRVFYTVALFYTMAEPLGQLPFAIKVAGKAWRSLRRLDKFLTLPEQRNYVEPLADPGCMLEGADLCWNARPEGAVYFTASSIRSIGSVGMPTPRGAPQQRHFAPGHAPCKCPATPFMLRDVTFQVHMGQLAIVAGRAGSGKSSLLHALLGGLEPVKGRVHLGGSVAYCAQQAWIINASVVNNIVMGEEVDWDAWRRAVEASGLRQELEGEPRWWQVEIGHMGAELTDAQVQMVQLARAAYQERDVYLLDDPFAQLESRRQANHVFVELINGVLRKKTRVLVTNDPAYLRHADIIIYLENGCVAAQGSYSQVSTHLGFQSLMSEQHHVGNGSTDVSWRNGKLEAAIDPKKAAHPGPVVLGAHNVTPGDSDDHVVLRATPRTPRSGTPPPAEEVGSAREAEPDQPAYTQPPDRRNTRIDTIRSRGSRVLQVGPSGEHAQRAPSPSKPASPTTSAATFRWVTQTDLGESSAAPSREPSRGVLSSTGSVSRVQGLQLELAASSMRTQAFPPSSRCLEDIPAQEAVAFVPNFPALPSSADSIQPDCESGMAGYGVAAQPGVFDTALVFGRTWDEGGRSSGGMQGYHQFNATFVGSSDILQSLDQAEVEDGMAGKFGAGEGQAGPGPQIGLLGLFSAAEARTAALTSQPQGQSSKVTSLTSGHRLTSSLPSPGNRNVPAVEVARPESADRGMTRLMLALGPPSSRNMGLAGPSRQTLTDVSASTISAFDSTRELLTAKTQAVHEHSIPPRPEGREGEGMTKLPGSLQPHGSLEQVGGPLLAGRSTSGLQASLSAASSGLNFRDIMLATTRGTAAPPTTPAASPSHTQRTLLTSMMSRSLRELPQGADEEANATLVG